MHAFDFSDEEATQEVDYAEEPPPLSSITRLSTRYLTVHVRTDDGFWHREHPSTTKTACGYRTNHYRSSLRQDRVIRHPLANRRPDGEVCDCWTADERAEANENYRHDFGRDFEYPALIEED